MNLRLHKVATGRAGLRPWLLALLGLGGCAYAVIRGGQINQYKADQVINGIQSVRDLSFTKPVPLVVRTRGDAEQMMLDDLARDHSEQQIEVEGRAGSMLGLYPRGIDLKGESVKLLSSEVAGFYDPHEREMVLVEDGAINGIGFWNRAAEFLIQRDLVGEMLLAHELTHALQDQHFDAVERIEKLKDDDDRALALKAVMEGDATIAGFGYVVGRTDNATVTLIASQMEKLPEEMKRRANGVPQGVTTPLVFQYTDGVRFVAEAFRRGGWNGVNALYKKPPESTKQVLDPSLYFDRFTAPDAVAVRGYETSLNGWNDADDDTFGELLLRTILEQNLGAASPAVALARRWTGDHLTILQNGHELTLLWMVAFEDAGAAAEFAFAYSGILEASAAGMPHLVDRRDANVLTIVGGGGHPLQELAPAIWAQSTVTKPVPPSSRPLLRASVKDSTLRRLELRAPLSPSG